ncbi:AAA family ATPase [Bacillus carboniphilus]|uniref:AAA family ATPase n=1 Tax=Bacillus carboniphilus TaxID=86663 RepID=A0ABY9JUE0_9BACI|nr:AAA family ATPase [Bacillus carboniphilus]WLR42045.1 AAA family ATPase [Bacillus carboniphilus]
MKNLVQQIINWINKTDEHMVIGISGHGAAGKTTFAQDLVNGVNQKGVNYINTDPYLVSSNVRKHAIIEYTYHNERHQFKVTACHPAAHNLGALERDIQMVREKLDFNTIHTSYLKSKLISSKNKVTIVEGMTVAFINPDLFDLTIYLYADGETELRRRSSRDIVERGADLAYLKRSHEERRIQYEVFMHPYSERFDIIVKNDDQSIVLEKNNLKNTPHVNRREACGKKLF